MGYKEQIVELAVSQIGYKEEGSNITKYAKYFDTTAWQYFNTKKQGVEWCAIFVNWLFAQVLTPDKARTFLGEPSPKNNCAAGVPYFWKYLSAKGYKTDVKKAQAGDIIFLNSNKHVGIVEKVDSSKIYTIEGNKSNAVKRSSYTFGSSSIYGVCHPDWSAIEPKPEPTPTPEPTPAPTPSKKTVVKASQPARSYSKSYARSYKVCTKTDPLNMRDGAGTDYKVLTEVPKNYYVRCYGYYTNDWFYVRYETETTIYEGFCNKAYLK